MPEFVNPFTGKIPDRVLTLRELVRAIRLDVAAEEEATHLYTAQADATDNPLAKKVLEDIANEERVHVGEFQHLIQLLTGDEDKWLADGAGEGAGTVAEDAETNAEEETTDGGGTETAGLGVELGESETAEEVDADHSRYDGGEHDLDDGKVGEEELIDDDFVLGDAPTLEEEAEDEAGDEGDDELEFSVGMNFGKHGSTSRGKDVEDEHGGGYSTNKEADGRDPTAKGKLEGPGDAVAAGATISPTRPESHEYTADKGNGDTQEGRGAEGCGPLGGNPLKSEIPGEDGGEESAEDYADDHQGLPFDDGREFLIVRFAVDHLTTEESFKHATGAGEGGGATDVLVRKEKDEGAEDTDGNADGVRRPTLGSKEIHESILSCAVTVPAAKREARSLSPGGEACGRETSHAAGEIADVDEPMLPEYGGGETGTMSSAADSDDRGVFG